MRQAPALTLEKTQKAAMNANVRRRTWWFVVLLSACGGGQTGSDGGAGQVSDGTGGASASSGRGSMDAGGSGAQASGGAGGASGSEVGGSSDAGGSGGKGSGGAGGANASSGAGGANAPGGAGGANTSGGAGGANASGGSGGTGVVEEDPCDATCHFVRADATGSGDGTSWTDAYTTLPATLERGHRYYVADGTYTGYQFDDAAAGTDWIVIRKATAARHGSDDGWSDDYGNNVAAFGTWTFSEPYYEVDGTSGFGFRPVGDYEGSVIDVNADHVVLRHLDVDGNFATDTSGSHVAGSCTGVAIGGSFVTIESSDIHDVADDGVSAGGIEELDFRGNRVHALHGCGTDGGCGPCYNGHSDGIEIYDVARSRFVGNFIHDVKSDATLFFGNWADDLGAGPSEYCEDIVLANNIFYAPEVGLMAYVQDARGLEVVHNVFWGVRDGSYGGLSIGQHVTGLRLFNNIILSINTAHTGGGFDASEHESDYNLYGSSEGQWTEGAHSVIAADPGFVGIAGNGGPVSSSPKPEDFRLKDTSPAVGKGLADASFPQDDFFGNTRDASPDMGAAER